MDKYEFESGRRPRIIVFFCKKSEKRSISQNARVTNTDESRRERQHASSRARRRQPLFYFAAQARKLSLSAPFAWAKGALNYHPRNSNGGAATEWAYPLYFGSIPRFLWCSGDRAVEKLWLRPSLFFWGAIAGVRCVMVCRRGRGWCPGRHS